MSVVYIAGPMTGLPEYNYPAFFAAQEKWEQAGWDVLNPAVIPPATPEQQAAMTREEIRAMFMRQDIAWVMEADAIALLSGWTDSVGAKTEVAIAKVLGHKIFDAETMQPIRAVPALHL